MNVEEILKEFGRVINSHATGMRLLAFGMTVASVGAMVDYYKLLQEIQRVKKALREADITLARGYDALRDACVTMSQAMELRLKKNEEEISALKKQVEELRNQMRGLPN